MDAVSTIGGMAFVITYLISFGYFKVANATRELSTAKKSMLYAVIANIAAFVQLMASGDWVMLIITTLVFIAAILNMMRSLNLQTDLVIESKRRKQIEQDQIMRNFDLWTASDSAKIKPYNENE